MKKQIFTLGLFFIFFFPLIAQQNDNFWLPVNTPKDSSYQFNGYTFFYDGTPHFQLAINNKGVWLLAKTYIHKGYIKHSLLYRSTDQGESWQKIDKSLPKNMGFLPEVNSDWGITQLVAVDSVFLLVATEKMMGHTDPRNNRILRSYNGGISWEIANDNPVSQEVKLIPQEPGKVIKMESVRSMPDRTLPTVPMSYQKSYVQLEESTDYGTSFRERYSADLDTMVAVKGGIYNTYFESITNGSSKFLKVRNTFWRKLGDLGLQATEGTNIYYETEGNKVSFGNINSKALSNPRDIELTRIPYLFVETGTSNLYTYGNNNTILKSTDGGKNWRAVGAPAFKYMDKLFPIPCSGNLYVSGVHKSQKEETVTYIQPYTGFKKQKTLFINPSWRSQDGGMTWQELKGLTAAIDDWDYDSDGTIYVATQHGLFKSREKECIGKPTEIKPTLHYGTTIITHDDLPVSPQHNFESWMERMAEAILSKAAKGEVYLYDPEKGIFEQLFTTGNNPSTGEKIFIFDWFEASKVKEQGYTEAAAEELYLALTKANIPKKDLQKIHFIGHGRGCIVNALAIERLYQRSPGQFSIDQVTNLGPYELLVDMGDVHPELKTQLLHPLPLPELPSTDDPKIDHIGPGVIKWQGYYSDTYWQDNGVQITYGLARAIGQGLFDLGVDKIKKVLNSRNWGESEAEYLNHVSREFKRLEEELVGAQGDENKIVTILKEAGSILEAIPSKQVGKALGRVLGVAGWALLAYDVYEALMESNTNSDGITGTENFHWVEKDGKTIIHHSSNDPLFEYLGIIDAYIQTIEQSEPEKCTFQGLNGLTGGYCLARLNNGASHRGVAPQQGYPVPAHDYFEDQRVRGKHRIIGVLNGSIDRHDETAPGWTFFGGNKKGTVRFEEEKIYLDLIPGKAVSIRHNRMFVPSAAEAISFTQKAMNVTDYALDVVIKDVNSGKEKVQTFPVLTKDGNKQLRQIIPVSGFQNKVVTIEFRPYSTHKSTPSYPSAVPGSLTLDDLRLLEKLPISASSSSNQNKDLSQEQEAAKMVSLEKEERKPVVTQQLTGNFSSVDPWSVSGGEAKVVKEYLALKPAAQKQAVSFIHPPVRVPQNFNTLSVLLNYDRVGKGDIDINIINLENNETTLVHHKEVKVSLLDNINKGLDKFNSTWDNLSLDESPKQFEKVRVDVSRFRGIPISIEIKYTPKGSGKPILFIDEVQFEY